MTRVISFAHSFSSNIARSNHVSEMYYRNEKNKILKNCTTKQDLSSVRRRSCRLLEAGSRSRRNKPSSLVQYPRSSRMRSRCGLGRYDDKTLKKFSLILRPRIISLSGNIVKLPKVSWIHETLSSSIKFCWLFIASVDFSRLLKSLRISHFAGAPNILFRFA